MEESLQVARQRETLALICDIAYKNEAAWYDQTEHPLRMSLLLPKYRERHQTPMPLLIWLCGGALHVVDHNIWIPQLLPFAEQGFVVASVAYRTVGDAALPAPLIDVKAAIRYLRAHARRYLIDCENVFVMGESAGAMLGGLAAVTAGMPEFEQGDFLEYDSCVSAVIDIYGISDLSASYESARGDLMRMATCLRKVGGTEQDHREKLERFSVVRYVNEKTVPFMILHGTADDEVDISQSEALYKRLEACGVPCEFYRIQGARHGADEFYQPQIVERMIAFLRRHMC